jgi:hypothetical protein
MVVNAGNVHRDFRQAAGSGRVVKADQAGKIVNLFQDSDRDDHRNKLRSLAKKIENRKW